eukprot:m.71757 g.71757  ORF g.71757 m.71757 type:complete len:344 (-) comp24388_c1_seq1:214-1245(-)
MPRGLTDTELKHFNERGFVVVKDVLTDECFTAFQKDYTIMIDEKIAELKKAGYIKNDYKDEPFDRKLAKVAADCSEEVLREHIDPFALSLDTMYARQKGFYDFQFNERLLTCVKSVVGGEITLNPIQHCRPFLPSRKGSHVSAGVAKIAPWHQDQGVTREEADESEILTVWIPLTDVTADTGCLQIIPDVTSVGLLEHVKSDMGTTIRPDLVDGLQGPRLDMAMNRGDLLFMNRFTPHRSQLNITDKVRWSLDLRFQKTGTPTGRPFWPEVNVLSTSGETVINKDNYEAWCKKWEADLKSSEGQRWHRVAGDVGGSVQGESTHSQKRTLAALSSNPTFKKIKV